jgi:hypothetical protein
LTDTSTDQPKIPELVLSFDNARPLAVADLGELFSAIAGDYRQLTRGRTLAVARLETGSLYAYLRDALNEFAPYAKDALELVKAAKGVKDFALTLTGLFRHAKEHPGDLGELKLRRRVGERSIEAMVKIAAGSQSVVELHHETGDGEIIDLKVTPIEAIHIKENTRPQRAKSRSAKTLPQRAGNEPPRGSLSVQPELFQSFDDADSLLRLYGPLNAYRGSVAEPAAIATLAKLLISTGLGALIPVIASNLEERGRHKVAEMLRAEARSQSRG